MAELEGFPCFEVEFTREGRVAREAQVQALLAGLGDAAPTDLLVISHGWNNDMAEARDLYARFLGRFRAQAGAHPELVGGRRFTVLAVLWPSLRFAEHDLVAGEDVDGSAAGLGGGASPTEADELRAELERMKGHFDAPDADERLERAGQLVPLLEDSPAAQREFADLLRGLPGLESVDDDARDERAAGVTLEADGDEVIRALAEPGDEDLPASDAGDEGVGGALSLDGLGGVGGDAAGLGGLAGGLVRGARKLANLVTYYQMKDRAGKVGVRGLAPVLRRVRQAHPALRIHLVGHSFGGRLVTAAAAGTQGEAPLPVASMTLLQAAFSHNGFAQDYEPGRHGFFRGVLTGKRVSGPILVTHTRRDRAVGWAYAVASRVARQQAAALGDPTDPYGGIGSNGAQHTPEAVTGLTLLAPGTRYDLHPGRIHNLKGDLFISGHSDVANDATAYAVLSALAST